MTDQTTSPAKKNWFQKHPLWAIALSIIMIGLIAGMLGGGAKKEVNTATTAPTATAKPSTKTVGLNTPVRDGKFEFTVNGVSCDNPSVTDSSGYLKK